VWGTLDADCRKLRNELGPAAVNFRKWAGGHNPDNTALIRKLKTADQAAYKELYLRYYPKLIGIGKKFGFSLLSPEDFVHETFAMIPFSISYRSRV